MKPKMVIGGGSPSISRFFAAALLLLCANTLQASPYLYVKGDYNMTFWSWGEGDYANYHLYGDGSLHNVSGWDSNANNCLMERGILNGEWWYRVDISKWKAEYGTLHISMRHYSDGANECNTTDKQFTLANNGSDVFAIYDFNNSNSYTTSNPGGTFLPCTLQQPYLYGSLDGWNNNYGNQDKYLFKWNDHNSWYIELTGTDATSEFWWKIKEGNSPYYSTMCAMSDSYVIGAGDTYYVTNWNEGSNSFKMPADANAIKTVIYVSRERGGGDGKESKPIITVKRGHRDGRPEVVFPNSRPDEYNQRSCRISFQLYPKPRIGQGIRI